MNRSSVTLTTYQAWNGQEWVPQPAPPVTTATGEGWEREPPWRCSRCQAPLTGDDTFSIIGGVVYCEQHTPRTTYCSPPLSVMEWLDTRTPHDRLEARVDQLGADVAALQRTIAGLELRLTRTTAAPHKHRWLGYMEGREICLDCDLVREV